MKRYSGLHDKLYTIENIEVADDITKYDWRIYVKNRKENVKPQT